MQSFRASPWVSYEPSSSIRHSRGPPSGSEMDEDVDMDAPQISTLREEASPPPHAQKRANATPKKRAAATSVETWVRGNNGDAEEEEDQLIDELIDDENDGLAKPSTASRSGDVQKRKVSLKLKSPRKVDKKPGNGEKKLKVSQATGAHNLAPTMSTFRATPAEAYEDIESMNSSPMPVPVDVKGKKKVSPRKPPAIPRAKAKLAKQKSAIPPVVLEDASVMSESYAGTAASSPITATFEQNTPEADNMQPSSPPPSSAPLLEETTNLENVPIPVYPLPTKPFPVLPPPKITTGFAPLIPLDKSGRKVRHWREANREIRGIAGGRWLAKTWVGEKESDYASHAHGGTAQGKMDDKPSVALPKLPSMSISAPGPLKVGKLKASSKSTSVVTSAAASRAPSVVPDPQISITSAVRAPTKMRILQQATSEGGDSEAMGPPES